LWERPGLRLPTDQAALNLVEEAISHATRAGQAEKALKLYTQVLGGHRHLAWKLGEIARGLRIIRGFSPCPDRWALGWYLRALGELEDAFEQHTLPFFRADIRLLQGRLTEVENARQGWSKDALAVLQDVHALRTSIGDSRATQTEALINSIRG
jgi:hypothetical protein